MAQLIVSADIKQLILNNEHLTVQNLILSDFLLETVTWKEGEIGVLQLTNYQIAKSLQKAYESFPEESSKITLESIMCDYLSNQHSLCKNPMVTCPEFDLFVPHKCPDPRYCCHKRFVNQF